MTLQRDPMNIPHPRMPQPPCRKCGRKDVSYGYHGGDRGTLCHPCFVIWGEISYAKKLARLGQGLNPRCEQCGETNVSALGRLKGRRTKRNKQGRITVRGRRPRVLCGDCTARLLGKRTWAYHHPLRAHVFAEYTTPISVNTHMTAHDPYLGPALLARTRTLPLDAWFAARRPTWWTANPSPAAATQPVVTPKSRRSRATRTVPTPLDSLLPQAADDAVVMPVVPASTPRRGDAYLDIALRAFAPPATWSSAPRAKRRGQTRRLGYERPHLMLVFDTETRTGIGQALLVAVARLYRRRRALFTRPDELPPYECIGEFIVANDEFPEAGHAVLDSDERSIVERYVETHAATAGVPCYLLTREQFLELLYQVGFAARGLICGFNLPFDLSRLARNWDGARDASTPHNKSQRPAAETPTLRDVFAGGFSLLLWADWDAAKQQWVRRERRPSIAIRTIDSKRHFIQFRGLPWKFAGHFLDLRTLAFAETAESHSLESASRKFGVPYTKRAVTLGHVTEELIEYCSEDVDATFRLACALLAEFDRYAISTENASRMPGAFTQQETRQYSPASVGKGHVQAMGVRPRLALQPDFDRSVLGYAMTAYFGGRAEARGRNSPVPVAHVDYLSEYSTVNVLMNIWRFVIAERVETYDATEEVRDLLARVTLETLYQRALWPHFCTLVQVRPNGEPLPRRARFGPTGDLNWGIGVGSLVVPDALLQALGLDGLWYFLPDVIAATIRGSRPPDIVRAIGFVPVGIQPGLQPMHLREHVTVDPSRDDLFKVLIEERQRAARDETLTHTERDRLRLFFKTVASATSYGVNAEMNPQTLPKDVRERVEVWSLWETPRSVSVTKPEVPGQYYFPVLAGLTTAAGRLLLMMLECEVARRGGTFAFVDTDSMAVVATRDGGPLTMQGRGADGSAYEDTVHALSWAEVREIVDGFGRLNPYDPGLVRTILKVEDVNFDPTTGEQRELLCYVISAKRYCFFTLDEDGVPHVQRWVEATDGDDDSGDDDRAVPGKRTWSEHGLGHLLNPLAPGDEDDEWMRGIWDRLLRAHYGLPVVTPDWYARPAISRTTAGALNVARAFHGYNASRRPDEQVGPFDFLITAHAESPGPSDHQHCQIHKTDCRARFSLIAPYNSDARQWRKLRWVCKHCGESYRITTGSAGGTLIRVQSYGDVIAEYAVHPEYKMLGPDGEPCSERTTGLLQPRPLMVRSISLLGKESNELEAVQSGLEHALSEVQTSYADPRLDTFATIVAPVLAAMPKRELSAKLDVTPRTVQRWRNGRSLPRVERRGEILRAAGAFAREALLHQCAHVPEEDLAACLGYVTSSAHGSAGTS